MKYDIVVIGSLNYDILVQQDRLPEIGETFTGNELLLMPGGKGANQAVQCAKLGLNVNMIGCVGNDIYGSALIKSLDGSNVSVAHITQRGKTSGIGIVQILESGDYCSTIIKGANYLIEESDISESLFKEQPLVILQSEIPDHVVERAIKLASHHHCKILLNNAPAREVSRQSLSLVDFLVVNETEASFMSKMSVASVNDALTSAAELHKRVRGQVIITLGEKGAVLSSDEGAQHYPAVFCPDVVDTTGAGDSFIGGIAYCLVNDISLQEAIPFAAEISSCSIQKYGGQSSFPMLPDVAHALTQNRQRLFS
ncbi:ribokinase [Affinibrenneria salicis]|uniref:Ribokinase n=1 Tax=Affinibrenneria salicis TaxID=2590031 RepID=A0A5J5FZJ7_9GAMM|nr:ribokinase [Affinibrenneria salicis]KAA8999465.1 ribokinase [Affinibrenneria salicis]